MDIGTILGLVSAITLIVAACLTGSTFGTMVDTFVDLPSVLIVFGGTFATIILMFPLNFLKSAFKVTMKCFFYKPLNYKEIVNQLVTLGEKARKESIVSLEKVSTPYPFLNRGLQLVSDGTEQGLLRTILDIDMSLMQQRHWRCQDIFKTMGTYAPAFGMIGTLIGLVQMLRNMDDPSSIGPAMAVALLTTLYGSLLSNIVFLPLAKKLEERSNDEYKCLELIREGILAIQKGEHPYLMREKLQSFLPASMREKR
ncbi:MAG: MotA/TolQ/ExbB proton channel family protein [Deltaproteobacteria bacterium]|jgi:chemotaxis protein MotA|nr:MotA/TolQ/ExbB proton channel family protein [Deltaproteobacteria bacterium]